MRQPFPPGLCLFYPRAGLAGSAGDSLGEVIVDDAPDGALCSVPGSGLYSLQKYSTEPVSSPTVIATGRGASSPGRWVQFSTGAPVPESPYLIVNPADPAAYQTITAALTAAAAAGTSAFIQLAKGTYNENLTIPSGLSTVQIVGVSELYWETTINGTITWDHTASKTLILKNLYKTGGNITGVVGVGAFPSSFVMNGVACDDNITFTGHDVDVVLASDYEMSGTGTDPFPYVGSISTTRKVQACGYFLGLATTAAEIWVENCVTSSGTLTATGTVIQMRGCLSSGSLIVFSGSFGVATLDQLTLSTLLAGGGTITNGRWGGRTIPASGATLTVAGGVVTITNSRHAIAGEGGLADDLVTISGGVIGQELTLLMAAAGTITVKNGTGNIFLAGADFVMDSVRDRLKLEFDGTNWCELSRANNG